MTGSQPVSRAAVRVGMIGAGHISDYHLGGLAVVEGVEVVAIASGSEARAARQAARWHVPSWTSDWRRVLERSDVDAVVITTPDQTHLEIATAAAAAGKAILLQKPMARTVAESEAILNAAARHGVLLCVSFMHRYFEEVVRLREVLAAGSLGAIHHVRLRNATPGPDWGPWFFSRENVRYGVVAQLGVHGIDLLRHLFGPIASVQAAVARLQVERTLADGAVVRPETDDHALAIYRFQAGPLATHEMSSSEVAGTDRFRLEVYGAAGTAWLRQPTGELALYAPTLLGASGWFTPRLPERPFGQRQHASFIAQVRGDEPPDGTAADGLAAMRVAEAIYAASAAGREVPVETAPGPAPTADGG